MAKLEILHFPDERLRNRAELKHKIYHLNCLFKPIGDLRQSRKFEDGPLKGPASAVVTDF